MPTAIWKSRLRSGSAHCDLQLEVEVRQCPLGSGARGGGPAVPTGIWRSRWRSGCAHWDLDCEEEEDEEEDAEAEEEENNNPHLAGGEKQHLHLMLPPPRLHPKQAHMRHSPCHRAEDTARPGTWGINGSLTNSNGCIMGI